MEHLSYRRKVTIMIAIMMALFFAMINQTIVGVALPSIIAQLGGMDYYTWIVTIFMLTSTVSTILVGKLSDIYGRKPFILAGIVIFMVGAFFSGASKGIIELIVFRGIQGVGAGVIMATAMTAIGDLFSPRERGNWSGLMSIVLGMSSILGPGLGGYIVDHFAWHWVFWIFLPLGLVAFSMILFLFPKVERRETESIDYVGSFFLTTTIVLLLLAFSWAGTKYAWTSSLILELFALAIISLAVFIFVESKVKSPVLPLYLFKDSIVTISNIIGFLTNAAMFGAIIYMPLFVQGVMGVSATYAGYVTMPMSVGMFAMGAVAGRQMTKTGKYKKLAVFGLTIMVIGTVILVVMSSIPMAVLSMVVFGCGLGLSMPVFMMAVQNTADSRDLGVVTATLQLFRNLGGTIGIALMGTILSTSMAAKMQGFASTAGQIKLLQLDPGVAPELARNLTQLQNPQILLDHLKLAAIQNSLPAEAQAIFSQLVEMLRSSLAASLTYVFLTGTIVMVVALVLTYWFKEIPLRTSVRHIKSEKHQDPAAAIHPLQTAAASARE